jgi:hypothetical protein
MGEGFPMSSPRFSAVDLLTLFRGVSAFSDIPG